jgi:DNA-directed DNA polymerase III PolC
LASGNSGAASRYVGRLGGLFGEDACLALEIHNAHDIDIAGEIDRLGQRFGLPVAAVQPIYCLEAGEKPRLRLLAAIDQNARIEEIPETEQEYHWQTKEEIAERFAAFPEAAAQTGQLAARCQTALPPSQPIWPILDLPKKQSPEEALALQALEGLNTYYGPEVPGDIQARYAREVEAIGRSGFAPLFIIVADIVRYAREQEIPVSTRGSVANSLVAFCTGITTVDPIENDLLFERFLNPARANPPDIDLDFCSRRRDEVLSYVRQKYGQERVSLVATISTMQPKSAVRETAKAFGVGEDAIRQLVRKLPRNWHPDPRRRDQRTVADIQDEFDDPTLKLVLREADALVGQPHHLSVHPGGVVITPGPLPDFVPVQMAPKGFLITQFDFRDVETIGLPKLDLLGIRALTVLADTAEHIQHFHNPDFHLDQIPAEDQQTAAILAAGDTIGVFQCESSGAQRTLRQLQAKNLTDLAIANAFFKPGPATGGMAQAFIRRYRGQEAVSYLHPSLEPILGSTQGVLLFQEQILRIATEIAGLNWEQADHLRRGMSKFKAKEMEAMQQQFVDGCKRPPPDGPGLSALQAQTLWEQVIPFAGYGFNKGHATAYADVSYRSAYLKAHYPAEFLCARLADWGGFHHPAVYMAEAVRLGIPVRPPHINRSGYSFTLSYEDDGRNNTTPTLWMGLGQVRDLRKSSIQTIIECGQERPFESLQDLLRRVSFRKKELRHLIQCGGLDGLGPNRAALLAEANLVKQAGAVGQMRFDFAQPHTEPETAAERLEWEQRILGQPLSVHPLELVQKQLGKTLPLPRLPKSRGRLVTIAGYRLPGWTGGSGFFLSDGSTYLTVQGDKSLRTPKPWEVVVVNGRYQEDKWETAAFQAQSIQPIDIDR